jgi:hypothetical protein
VAQGPALVLVVLKVQAWKFVKMFLAHHASELWAVFSKELEQVVRQTHAALDSLALVVCRQVMHVQNKLRMYV